MPPKPKGDRGNSEQPQTREEFLASKPYGLRITVEPLTNRGEGLPNELAKTTQEHPYMTYKEMWVGQKTVIAAVLEALANLGLKAVEAEEAMELAAEK